MQAPRNRLRVYLTHTAETLENYYGPRALAALRAVAEVRLNETGRHLAGAELAAAAAGCQAIICYRQSPGEAATFAAAPDLVAFHRCAVDIRNIDVAAASAAGVLVTQATPGFIPSVAELVIGQMIDLARGISGATTAYHAGIIPAARMGRQLNGSTLGIIGYGAIGRYLAPLGLALGMRVLVADPFAAIEDPRLRALPLRDAAGRGGFHRLPRHRQRGDGEPAGCRRLRPDEARRLLPQPLARQSGG